MAAQQQRAAVTYYMIREGKPPHTIIAIHRVYDSAVACFQMIMNTGAVEAIDMWGVCTNDRGLKTTEWVIHSYVREKPDHAAELNQHGAAGVRHEERIAPLRVPAHTELPTPNTLVLSIQPDPSLEAGGRCSP
jgi:hypothetical protein